MSTYMFISEHCTLLQEANLAGQNYFITFTPCMTYFCIPQGLRNTIKWGLDILTQLRIIRSVRVIIQVSSSRKYGIFMDFPPEIITYAPVFNPDDRICWIIVTAVILTYIRMIRKIINVLKVLFFRKRNLSVLSTL